MKAKILERENRQMRGLEKVCAAFTDSYTNVSHCLQMSMRNLEISVVDHEAAEEMAIAENERIIREREDWSKERELLHVKVVFRFTNKELSRCSQISQKEDEVRYHQTQVDDTKILNKVGWFCMELL